MSSDNGTKKVWAYALVEMLGDVAMEVDPGILAGGKLPDEFEVHRVTRLLPQPMQDGRARLVYQKAVPMAFGLADGGTVRLRAFMVVSIQAASRELVDEMEGFWTPAPAVKVATEADAKVAAEAVRNRLKMLHGGK